MGRVRVKICGITNRADAFAAVDAGADALGFVFAPSARSIDPDAAKSIVRQLPPFVARVGVFKDERVGAVLEIMNHVGLDFAQLHGEEPVYAERLGLRAIKVFLATEPDVLTRIQNCAGGTFMLDMPKNAKATILDKLEIACRAAGCGNLILAGGLRPDNVKEAIARIKPYAVDVASGVEERPGKKSKAKLEAFFGMVREAEREI